MKRVQFFLVLAILAVLIISTLALNSFVRETIAIPIYHQLWKIGLLFSHLSQETYLSLVAIFGILLVMQGLIRIITAEKAPRTYSPTISGENRYQFWHAYTSNVDEHGDFARSQFFIELRLLVLSILAEQEGITQVEVERRVARGKLLLPPEVRMLVMSRRRVFTGGEHNSQGSFGRFFGPPPGDEINVSLSTSQLLERIVNFIENRLEVKRDSTKS